MRPFAVTLVLAALLAAAWLAWVWRNRACARAAVAVIVDGLALTALSLLTARWLLGPPAGAGLGTRLLIGAATFAALTWFRHALGGAVASRRIALAAGALVAVHPAFQRLAHLGVVPLTVTALGFAAAAHGLAFARSRARLDLAVATAAAALVAHVHAGVALAAVTLVVGGLVWCATGPTRPSRAASVASIVLGGVLVAAYLATALGADCPAPAAADLGGAGAEAWGRGVLVARGESFLYPLLLVAGMIELAARRADALFVAAAAALVGLAWVLGGARVDAAGLVRETAPVLPALFLLVGLGLGRLDAWLVALRLPPARAHGVLVGLALHWQWLAEKLTWTP